MRAPSVPHVESTISGRHLERYEWGEMSVQASRGLEAYVARRLSVLAEYKADLQQARCGGRRGQRANCPDVASFRRGPCAAFRHATLITHLGEQSFQAGALPIAKRRISAFGMTHGRRSRLARTVGGRYITFLSLVALVLGLGLGMVLHGSRAAWVPPLANALNVVGTVWIRVLQFTVVPLVVTQAFAAVMRTERLGTLGGKTLALFVVMLTAGALFTLLASPPLLALYSVDAATVSALRDAITVPETVRDALGSETDLGDWLWGFIPTNAGRLFRGANFLLVLVSVIVLALLVKRLAGVRREAMQRGATRVAGVRRCSWLDGSFSPRLPACWR